MKFLSINDVCKRLGISRTTLWKLEKSDNSFPKKRFITPSRVAFIDQEIEDWMQETAITQNRFEVVQ